MPESVTPGTVARNFRRLLANGYRLRADGTASAAPTELLQTGYTPRYHVSLFDSNFYLGNQRDVDGMKVLPAFVLPTRRSKTIYARVFYKDSSLVWRSASHYVNTPEEEWIGKGAVKWIDDSGTRRYYSAEETTNLPFELQAALDEVSRRGPRSRRDNRILTLLLRNAPAYRVWPYRDFEGPRERAMRNPENRINGGQPVAWFEDESDPDSLHFEPGYEPDFDFLVDQSGSRSSMYGGTITKYRFASKNRLIQYLFVSGPYHTWIVHPQAFTTELFSYGLRTVDVIADEPLSVPGFEFFDNVGHGEVDDQIPAGYAGDPCPVDPDRADASPWNHSLSVIRQFRDKFLS